MSFWLDLSLWKGQLVLQWPPRFTSRDPPKLIPESIKFFHRPSRHPIKLSSNFSSLAVKTRPAAASFSISAAWQKQGGIIKKLAPLDKGENSLPSKPRT